MKSTVQDVGEVITSSREQLPAKYAGSISFEEHDFFKPQKQIADCYILRFILHNWSDAKAQDIIRNLSPALRPGARVLGGTPLAGFGRPAGD
jgi:6-hydroxytryprostatin B O-methyltransferase